MVQLPSRHSAGAISTACGIVYAVVVLAWLFSSGVSFADDSLPTVVVGFLFAGGGMFLTGAVPVYLLLRLSLVTPALMTLWILGETVWQWRYGTHLHPLSSYLTVWPLLLGVAVGVGMAEALVRTGADHWLGRFGLWTLR
ncbi:hypothetical protein ACFQL1_12760 [Halomicroarcula sp. GCM10025709]|uniref:hypothetical protein n=1 Tax=Haloarcula TaxID=2237 RepID=UPI0024C307C7|nr:hypothetical protein [Halomicroarcula sp. YJ-61-S]